MFYSLASTFAFFTAQASGRMMQEAETKPCTDAYFSAGQESRVRDEDDRYFRVLRRASPDDETPPRARVCQPPARP